MIGRPTQRSSLAAQIAARIPAAPPGVEPRRETIADAVALIAERFHPERILLFGSRVYGAPTPSSDVDLMVVMETPLSITAQAELIRETIDPLFRSRLHPTVRTPRQIKIGLAERDFFILDAIERGVPLFTRSATSEDGIIVNTDDEQTGTPSQPTQAARGWITKAEIDVRMARRAADPADPIPEGVSFHAQQIVEKYLKAMLQNHDIEFPRTHNLADLARLAAPVLPDLGPSRSDLLWLTSFAVAIRYPDSIADPADGDRALRLAIHVRASVRAALGLPPAADE
jgi:HEPN domain-containing protein/predicted nucleotidyltransferase